MTRLQELWSRFEGKIADLAEEVENVKAEVFGWTNPHQSHIDAGGTQCPNCLSIQIDHGILVPTLTPGQIARQVFCNDCGAIWNDIYRLADIEIVSYPKDMEEYDEPDES